MNQINPLFTSQFTILWFLIGLIVFYFIGGFNYIISYKLFCIALNTNKKIMWILASYSISYLLLGLGESIICIGFYILYKGILNGTINNVTFKFFYEYIKIYLLNKINFNIPSWLLNINMLLNNYYYYINIEFKKIMDKQTKLNNMFQKINKWIDNFQKSESESELELELESEPLKYNVVSNNTNLETIKNNFIKEFGPISEEEEKQINKINKFLQ